MGVQRVLLLALGVVILAHSSVSSSIQGVMRNFTNLRERLPEMVAQLNAAAYEEFSEESSRSVEELDAPQKYKRLASNEEGIEYQVYQGVMGRPGVDFPVLQNIPRTEFTCKKVKKSGYYADLDTDCQVFHICDQGRKISFLCPNGTIFRQSHLICDWWWTVDCGSSVDLYESSAEQLATDQRVYKERSKVSTQASARVRTSSGSGEQQQGGNQRGPQVPPGARRQDEHRQAESFFTASSSSFVNPPVPSPSSPPRPSANPSVQRPEQNNGNVPHRQQQQQQHHQQQQQQQPASPSTPREGRRFNVDAQNPRRPNNQINSQQRTQFSQQQNLHQNSPPQQHQQSRFNTQNNQGKVEIVMAQQAHRAHQNQQQNQQVQPNSQKYSQQNVDTHNRHDQQSTTARPRGSGKSYNNIRFNYGSTGGENESQISSETASFVSSKGNQFNNFQNAKFLQPPGFNYNNKDTFDYSSTTYPSSTTRSSNLNSKSYVELDRSKNVFPSSTAVPSTTIHPPLARKVGPAKTGPSANQPPQSVLPSFRKRVELTDEDGFSNRGRGPPTKDFYQSTTTEVVPITDVVQPSGRPFTAEDITRTQSTVQASSPSPFSRDYVELDRSRNQPRSSTPAPTPTVDAEFSKRVKPIYIHVTTREGRTSTESSVDVTSQAEQVTEAAPSAQILEGVDALSKAIATLGPRLNPKYVAATTTFTPQQVSVFTHNCTGLQPPYLAHSKPDQVLIPHLSLTEEPPVSDIFQPNANQYPRQEEYNNQRVAEVITPQPLSITELPPVFETIPPTGIPLTNNGEYVTSGKIGELPTLSNTELPPFENPTTFVYMESERSPKELQYKPQAQAQTKVADDVKTRADVLHTTIEEIVYGNLGNSVLNETLKETNEQRKQKSFTETGRGGAKFTPSNIKSASPTPIGAQDIPPSTTGPIASTIIPSYETIPTTLLPPNLYNEVNTYSPPNTSLTNENSKKESITIEPSNENIISNSNAERYINGDRTGLDIPTASGPGVLHSLAVYFSANDEVVTTEPTVPDDPHKEELLLRLSSTYPDASVGYQSQNDTELTENEGIVPSLLTQFTKESYQALFPETAKDNVNDTDDANLLQTQSSGNFFNNDLTDTKTTTADVSDFKFKMSENTSNLRELAQVFSRALSAYLEDPEEFRKVLSEIRPTPPGVETTASTSDVADGRTPATTTKEYSDHEEDEVLEYSDDSKTRKRPTIQKIYSQQELDKERKKSTVDTKYSSDRKGKALVTDIPSTFPVTFPGTFPATFPVTYSVTYQSEVETTTIPPAALQLVDLTDPTRLPFETLENSQSSYYSSPQQQVNNNKNVDEEIKTEKYGDEALTNYNLPPGTKQFEGPKYGPQPIEKTINKTTRAPRTRHRFTGFNNDYRSHLRRKTTTVPSREETTTYIPTTTTQVTTQGNFEGTTFAFVNQYDGYPIPVLNSELEPPFDTSEFQNDYTRENDSLLVHFAPQELNNLAVFNASDELSPTEDTPTTTTEDFSETTTLPPPTTTTPIPTTPFVTTTTTTTTTTAVPTQQANQNNTTSEQYVRFSAKQERQGRRVAFSRNYENEESLIRAHTARFASRNSKNYQESKNSFRQGNSINGLVSAGAVDPFTINQELVSELPATTTPQTRPSERPAPRRRIKVSAALGSGRSAEVDRVPQTEQPFFLQRIQNTETVLDTSTLIPVPVIQQRYRSTTTTTTTTTKSPPEPVQSIYTTTLEPIPQTNLPIVVLPQNNARPSVSTSMTFSSKVVKSQRKSRPSSAKAAFVPETTVAEPERYETTTLFPETTMFPITEMPTEKEMSMEAEMMFGALNESSINHLMDMMKMAESNSTVRRLVLLLVNHGPQTKTTEESRRHLIEALLRAPDETIAEAQHGENSSGPLQQLNATTSMKVSMTVGTSTKVSNRRGKNVRTSQESNSRANSVQTTTPGIPATTYRNNARRIVYKPTVPTTTRRSVDRKRLSSSTSSTTTMKVSTSSGSSTVMTKKIYEKLTNDSPGSQVSDNRAIDLLRSLYSLAARFG